MPESLPERQRATLEALEAYWREHGVAPSLGDLAAILGVSRPTAHGHVRALQRKGYIDAQEGVPRSWQSTRTGSVRIPVLGRVAAGAPIFAEENIEGWVTFDGARSAEGLFALRVQGQSMRDGGILDGDLVIVRQQASGDEGDIVVALVDGEEATVKKLLREGDRVRLQPMNPDFEPLVLAGDRVSIQGKVVGLRRDLGDGDL